MSVIIWAMPSLTLCPCGNDRSVIRCHFPVLWPLGITPKRLMCSGGTAEVSLKGPSRRPRDSSLCRWSVMIWGRWMHICSCRLECDRAIAKLVAYFPTDIAPGLGVKIGMRSTSPRTAEWKLCWVGWRGAPPVDDRNWGRKICRILVQLGPS